MSRSLTIFERQVDDWVLECIGNRKIHFDEILTHLPGVYPTFVKDSLNRLISDGLVPTFTIGEESIELAENVAHHSNSLHIIDEERLPHPLDYDWRFSGESIKLLAEYCNTLTLPDDNIVCLGTPTLFNHSPTLLPKRKVVLFDKNPVRSQYKARKSYSIDLMRDALPRPRAKLVVADPPWYPDYISMFMWGAARICKKHGHVLFCMPAVGARPGIKRELHETFTWARHLGLECIGYRQSVISYSSPLFERNALRKEGIENVPNHWRHGDLALFKKMSNRIVSRPLALVEDEWKEINLKGIVFKMRPQLNSQFQDPSLESLVPDDMLPSVSRRVHEGHLQMYGHQETGFFAARVLTFS